MKRFLCMLSILFLTTSLVAAAPPESKGTSAMERMKSLEGVWEGKDPEGNAVTISYKLVSAGSSVEETIDHGKMGHDAMVTMYHLDGDKLMMTHYCSMGNQPRMRSKGLLSGRLDFSYVDATNLKSPAEHRMTRLVMSFPDGDHFVQEWTSKEGAREHVGRFEFTRKK